MIYDIDISPKIFSFLRGKKARDRTSAEPNEEDTADRDTFLAQGQHELKYKMIS